MNKPLIYIAIPVVAALGVGIYFFTTQKTSTSTVLPPPVSTTVETTAPVPPPVPPAADELTEPETDPVVNSAPAEPALLPPPESLTDSDVAVLALVNNLSPPLTGWLVPDEQVRKWVLTVDLMAEGKTPPKYLPLEYPMEKFQVDKSNGKITISPNNFSRADKLVAALEQVEPATVASYLRYWQPLADSAYGELGKSGTFMSRAKLALTEIVKARPLPENATLVQPSVFYKYEDPALQNSSDIQKLLWRMGPKNMQKVQAYARALLQELE